MDEWGLYPTELRQEGNELTGSFPYLSNATMASTGRVRKEQFEPRAFSYAVNDAARDIHLLVGHSYDAPLASKLSGSLTLEDTDEALNFRAALPEESKRPSWMRDALLSIGLGLMVGVSPGFNIPPLTAVAVAEAADTGAGQSVRLHPVYRSGGSIRAFRGHARKLSGSINSVALRVRPARSARL